jgi:hypothetical protein
VEGGQHARAIAKGGAGVKGEARHPNRVVPRLNLSAGNLAGALSDVNWQMFTSAARQHSQSQ